MDPLAPFSAETRAWFKQAFAEPTPAQQLGWPAIASGKHTLIQAPTGSGKTLAAFLYGIDKLHPEPGEGLRLLYVSPLKALNYDIERNLRGPLAGLKSELRVAVRTGDTPQKERAEMLRHPPDILITTPESLYLLLTSRARENLRGVRTLILDEVHAVAGTKRGAHLALSVERLERLVDKPFQRVGLSATQRPLEEIGRFVSGAREIQLVDAGTAKELDLQVVMPLEDMREPEQTSIWPSIYPELLRLVREHRSTILFVNNRRLAERLALRLNELAEQEIARAHHGSLAREQRVEIEELLKAGEIPCLVATSSLELGIDMGAVDLVLQVESPKSVARGLQRIGRAGHELGAVSKGRIFPKFRADLLESAVVAKRMLEGAIEETVIPRNPLDVLAQQIVAIAAEEEIAVDDLHELVRGAYPFADLSRTQLENVLDMLAGRYPSDEFAELRPRIVWDRTAGVIRGRSGVRRLAVTNAGTIPDRGLYGVHLVDGGGRVGELDEEMVYEARAGQTFLLGASTWRIEEITRDRVLVSPAPGVPGAVPFWKGEGVGRPYELGEAIGRASRELVASSHDRAVERLTQAHSLDERAAENLLTFLHEQQAVTGAVPSDRTVVVERFRAQPGDWRVCLLAPFGARVHAPWALALGARLRESLGIEVHSLWSDDGIALHLPDADALPPTDDVLLGADEVEDLVVLELGASALFGARFRENAARALLIPRRRSGERTPLWQQRLKAQGLLQVARRYGSFPVILETYRECLQDVFDLPSLKRLLQGLRTRELDLVDVETASASPYSASLLFDYIATYMYEDDTPPAERRAQALSLDRDLLRELLGQDELRDLLDAGAVEEVEAQLRGSRRSADHLPDRLPLRAALRKEVEPAEQASLGRFLPNWHGIDRRATLREALVPLQGLSLPVSLWESDVLPRRVPGFNPGQLDQLCSSGELVWVGAGLDRVAVYFREDAPALGRPAAAPRPEDDAHDRIREALGRSAEFWYDLVAATGLEPEVALPALWDLVWAGEVTNDAWTPLRAGRRYQAPKLQRGRARRFSRQRSAGITATQGRWSPTDRLFAGSPDSRALAELLLERQGIVTRDGVRGEGIPGGYGAVYGELRALETLGVCRRGYFVEGLGGAQFALPGAVERLRELRPREDEDPEPLVLAAADPAQPYGAALPWPKQAGGRAAPVPGASVVLLGGEAALFVERGGRSLVPLREPDESWLRVALAALVEHVKRGGAKRLAVERFDGEPVGETEIMPLLLEAGFLAGPRRAVLRP